MKNTDIPVPREVLQQAIDVIKRLEPYVGYRGIKAVHARNLVLKNLQDLLTAPDWVQAGDGTLHGAIDHWQERALKAEALLTAPAVEPQKMVTPYISQEQFDRAFPEAQPQVQEPVPFSSGKGPDAPYPGMIEAFENRYGQSFTDKDWRTETGVWAAAWKAAKAHGRPQVLSHQRNNNENQR